MSILNDISSWLQQGRAPKVKACVQQALDEGIPAGEILEQGLLDGMNIIGQKFKNNEVFVPEVLIAARAMTKGIEVLRPHLVADGVEEKGTPGPHRPGSPGRRRREALAPPPPCPHRPASAARNFFVPGHSPAHIHAHEDRPGQIRSKTPAHRPREGP